MLSSQHAYVEARLRVEVRVAAFTVFRSEPDDRLCGLNVLFLLACSSEQRWKDLCA